MTTDADQSAAIATGPDASIGASSRHQDAETVRKGGKPGAVGRAGARRHAVHDFVVRIADIMAGLAIVTLGAPLLAALAIAIRVDSRGPAIFAQRRIGRNQRAFTLFKFRTMAVGTAQVGTHEVSSSTVTRVGRWLRHTKLDELPQAVNLLMGTLTLVGPRPCLPAQAQLIEERSRRGVFALKPGLTGLAQVNDIDMRDPIVLAQWDAAYADRRSLALDIRLLIETILGRGRGDRVLESVRATSPARGKD